MSTPDETSQPLTRRQLRELKLTGQTPVISAQEIEDARVAREADEARAAEDARAAEEARSTEETHLITEAEEAAAREALAAEAADPAEPLPAEEAEEANALEAASEETSAPLPFADVDGEPRLTRREIREQERLRTNQFSVITPDQEGEVDGSAETEAEPQLAAIETKIVGENETSVLYEVVEVPFEPAEAADEQPADSEIPVEELVFDEAPAEEPVVETPHVDAQFEDAVETVFVAEDIPAEAAQQDQRPTVAPEFGSSLLQAPTPSVTTPSFEDILSQAAADSSGSATASSALILATDPGSIPLSAPIDATGEILITRTHQLPDGFGSSGHAAGTTDGKDVDVVLIDGEIPLASSPTPIAASDAVSTSKSPAEVIRPPAPEKSHRLTLLLGITAGVLGIALIGVVVAAFTTGVLG
ncbi:hypothetical protein ACOKGD_07145 [Microbacterium phosphatis]|uniref:hypothetical protein n=1 Tax=Microbacterium phosphatis TaxID=3140248 RepID=UPI003140428D